MSFRKFLSPWEEARLQRQEVNSNGDNASNTLGTCLIRFADVLLMKAEALIWKNGEGDAEAKQLLNRIRKRARLPENSRRPKPSSRTSAAANWRSSSCRAATWTWFAGATPRRPMPNPRSA